MLALSPLVEPVLALAKQAAEHIMAIYSRSFTVMQKADKSLVTEADMMAHDTIVGGLGSILPLPVLSEEDPRIPVSRRQGWERLWLVDPLDGTWQFVHRNGEFSINIALIERHEAIFGLILMPATQVCYYAFRGGGAYKRLPTGQTHPIRCRRVATPPLCLAGSRTARGSLREFLQRLGTHNYMTVGSALKSCLVAEGEADLYPRFGPTGEWDTAAAQIILEEAGGRLTNTAMEPLRYNARNTLINPDFFAFGDPCHDWSLYLPTSYHCSS